MRTLYLAVSISLLLVAANAYAQSSQYPITSDQPMSTVQVTAPLHTVHVSSDQTRAVSGAYEMSNGWYLHVRPAWDGVVARIDDQKPMRLVALSPDRYVTPDGNVTMDFNRGPDREDMAMSYIPDPRLAERIVVTASMASR